MTDQITLPREVVEAVLRIVERNRDWSEVRQSGDYSAILRTALAAPRPEPVFDGQSGHPVMLPRASVPVLGLISDEVRAELKAADAVENQEAYRTRAAAPEPEKRHPGYVIGSHWLETAYSRICAGEAEADVLRDIGLVREEAFLTGVAHLKADNERLREKNNRLREKNERLRQVVESLDVGDPAWKLMRAALRREET